MSEQSDLEAEIIVMEKMASSGVLITRHGDTSVQFRSLSELLKMLRFKRARLRALLGLGRSRVSYIRQSNRGYGPETEDV